VVINTHMERSPLRDIALKVEKGVRLTEEDALRLYGTNDLHALAALADHVKTRLHGDRVFYNRNRHVDHSNLCMSGCDFCSYARPVGAEGAFELTHDEIVAKALSAASAGATELHVVGGLHPMHPFEWYEGMLRKVRSAVPGMHLKCFTAVEIHYFTKLSGLTHREVLARLKAAGLDSLPGGGAEIFHEDVRGRACPGKATAGEWGRVHREAHRLGLASTATMLYGYIEDPSHRVDHLRRLREWQDETHGFTTFIPLAYHRDRDIMPERTVRGGVGHLKNFAVARLYLDNFPHVKAYWIMLGLPLTQVSLSFGVDDVDGTVGEERIYHMTGADTPVNLPASELEALIRETGRIPVERDSLYREAGKGAP